MNLGAHISIAGGIHNAFQRGVDVTCNTIQVFTKNASQWKARPLTEQDRELYIAEQARTGIKPVVAHDSYLINLASPDKALWNKSIEAFIDELGRCEFLGIPYLVTHPGTPKGESEAFGLERMVESLSDILERTADYKVMILLETTAGQGSNLGYKFEHLAYILDKLGRHPRLGTCFDTCHVFSAGYDITTSKGFEQVLLSFDATIGLDTLKVFHLNDAKSTLGKRVDRHAHIGQGNIGLEAFEYLLNHHRFKHTPMLLETPKEDDMDIKNLQLLRSLRGKNA